MRSNAPYTFVVPTMHRVVTIYRYRFSKEGKLS